MTARRILSPWSAVALLGTGVVAALCAAPTRAAPAKYGTLAFGSLRSCSGVGPTIECPGGPNLKRVFDGGPGTRAAATRLDAAAGSAQAGSFATAAVEFGVFKLPILHGSSYAAGSDARVNGSPQGWQTLTYTGKARTPFGLRGRLTVDASTASPANGLLPGGGIYVGFVGIWDVAAFPVSNVGPFFGLPGAGQQCGTPGLLAFGITRGLATGGSFGIDLRTVSCGAGPLFLDPGQQVVAHANVSLFTNRGGFIDASQTFVTDLDPDLGAPVLAALAANLTPAVPEPGTWALLLTGFATVGAMARRRRGGRVVAA